MTLGYVLSLYGNLNETRFSGISLPFQIRVLACPSQDDRTQPGARSRVWHAQRRAGARRLHYARAPWGRPRAHPRGCRQTKRVYRESSLYDSVKLPFALRQDHSRSLIGHDTRALPYARYLSSSHRSDIRTALTRCIFGFVVSSRPAPWSL